MPGNNRSYLGDTLVGLIMHLETAQFVWVVEYCSVAQWQAGRVAARADGRCHGEPKGSGSHMAAP